MAVSCGRAAGLARRICRVYLRSSTVLAGRLPGRCLWSRMDLLGVDGRGGRLAGGKKEHQDDRERRGVWLKVDEQRSQSAA